MVAFAVCLWVALLVVTPTTQRSTRDLSSFKLAPEAEELTVSKSVETVETATKVVPDVEGAWEEEQTKGT